MKALGMVIFSHIRSRTSRPDSGLAIALATAVMSLWTVRWFSSWTPEKQHSRAGLQVEQVRGGRMLQWLMGAIP